MTRPSASDVMAFWRDGGADAWYRVDPAFDAEIAARFGALWEDARDGALGLWLMDPADTLAFLILTDQFPRNMFRGQAAAFATDPMARAAAKSAIAQDWDLTQSEPMRQFFYLPLMHSENLIDQDRAVDLMGTRLPDAGNDPLHARAHREVIRQFGRFPFRNAALGRVTSATEQAWLDAGAYGAVVRALQDAAKSQDT